MNKNKGWTIIQTMVALLVAGLVIGAVAKYFLNERCEAEPSRPVCAER